MKRIIFAVAISLALWCVGENAVPVRAEQEGWKEISAPEVKIMIENGDAVAVHVLSEIEYDIQHITGSINIPIIKIKTSDKLPKDKEMPLIFYCMGKR